MTGPVVPRRRPPRPRFYISLTLVTCGTALFAIGFREMIKLVYEHAYGASNVLASFEHLPLIARVALPCLGGVAAGGASAIADRSGGGSGVGEVMEAVVLGDRRISIVATSWKALGSWFAIVTGGSIGREGPLIQFGGALGSTVGTRFAVSELRQRALISAGTAAGFAAAYNTPFAAVLFVTEVVTGVEALGQILPAMFAAAVATAITRFAVGPGPLYGQHSFALNSQAELVLYFLVGALGGVVGSAFMRALKLAEQAFRALPVSRPIRAGLGGLLVGALACAMPAVTGNGYEATNLILASQVSLAFVAVFVIVKIVGTTSSVASGSPGGVFTPSLALGAAVGALVAGGVTGIAPSLHIGPAGGYALVGMAAVSAATTRAPLMAAVLVFELSGDYNIAVPLVIATMAAVLVSRWYEPASIYMQELQSHGLGWEVTIEGRVISREEPESPDQDEDGPR